MQKHYAHAKRSCKQEGSIGSWGKVARWTGLILMSGLPLAPTLAAPGDLDTTFDPAPVATNTVLSLGVMNGTNVLVGGWVSTTNLLGDPIAGIVRLSPAGTVDPTFAVPAVATAVTALAVTVEGQVVCVGRQTNGLNGVVRRLNSDGTLDATLDVAVSSPLAPWLYSVAVQTDGKLLVAGSFTSVAGLPRTNLVRLQTNGLVDLTFKTNFITSGAIETVALQSNGRILIGGAFTNVNGVVRSGIARLNADGTLDTSFNPGSGLDGPVKTIRVQADNRILLGGHFFNFNKIIRQGIARLLTDGSLDTSFDPGTGAEAPSAVASSWPAVEAIEIQGDGRLVLGGKFTVFDGVARAGIVRLHWDGSVDTSFDPGLGPNGAVSALAIQPDGHLLIGGDFTQVGGSARQRVARVLSNGTTPVTPVITLQPTSQSVVVGRNITFSVEATGTPTLLYQWLKEGFALAGQTNTSLTIANGQDADAGAYSVTVSNAGGFQTSQTASLTVTPIPVAPLVVTQPQSQLVEQGSAVTLTATASGSIPQVWKWRLGAKDVAGATSATLALSSVTTNQAGVYSAVVTNGAGSATSGNASLSVVVPPAAQTSPSTSNVTFRAQVYGTGPFTYQWRLGGTDLPGATAATLLVTNVDLGDAGNYAVVVANAAGSLTSSPALLTVQMPPLITGQPANQSIALGSPGTLQVTVAGSDVITYQWRRNGTNLPGATSAILPIAAAQSSDAGYYSVVAINPFGSATSRAAALTVTGATSALFRLESASGSIGSSLTVPLNLIGLGNENTISLSVAFDPTVLTLQSISNGTAIVPGVTVVLNTNDASKGKSGVLIARAAGDTFTAGTNHLLTLSFKATTSLTGSTNTTVAFASSPLAQELVSTTVSPLAANYLDATVTLDAGYEGDVAAEPNGDGQLTAADWTLVGRLVATLSKPLNAGEFARADCAPAETRGDGALTAGDWTQTGRYVVGLDTLQVTGGPAKAALQSIESSESDVLNSVTDELSTGAEPARTGLMSLKRRTIGVIPRSSPIPGGVALAVQLLSLGDENTAAFTLRFDPARLRFRAVLPGSALGGGSALMLNTNRATEGRIGVLLGQAAGKTFPAGIQELLQVELASVSAAAQSTSIYFDDQPVVREVVSPLAKVLSTTFEPGTVLVEPAVPAVGPIQAARDSQGALRIRWTINAPGMYTVETSTNLVDWTAVQTFSVATEQQIEFQAPTTAAAAQQFYRLR